MYQCGLYVFVSMQVWKVLIDKLSLSEVLVNVEFLQIAGMLEEQNLVDGQKVISRPQLTSHLIAAISKATVSPALAYIVYCNYKNNRGYVVEFFDLVCQIQYFSFIIL